MVFKDGKCWRGQTSEYQLKRASKGHSLAGMGRGWDKDTEKKCVSQDEHDGVPVCSKHGGFPPTHHKWWCQLNIQHIQQTEDGAKVRGQLVDCACMNWRWTHTRRRVMSNLHIGYEASHGSAC